MTQPNYSLQILWLTVCVIGYGTGAIIFLARILVELRRRG